MSVPVKNPLTGFQVDAPTGNPQQSSDSPSSSKAKESGESNLSSQQLSFVSNLTNFIRDANDFPFPRFFLYEGADEAYVSTISESTNPCYPQYMVPEGLSSEQEREFPDSLAIGKLSWKNIPLIGDPSGPRSPADLESFKGQKFDREGEMGNGSDSAHTEQSVDDTADQPGPEQSDLQPKPKMFRAKCCYVIKSGGLIERRRWTCWVEKATLSKNLLHTGYNVQLDKSRTWKIQKNKHADNSWIWNDHNMKPIAVEFEQTSQCVMVPSMELRLLEKLSEHQTEFMIAVWVARVAIEIGTLDALKTESKLGSVLKKFRESRTANSITTGKASFVRVK